MKDMANNIFKDSIRNIVSKAIKWGFWTSMMLYPSTMIATFGVSGVSASALIVYSGII